MLFLKIQVKLVFSISIYKLNEIKKSIFHFQIKKEWTVLLEKLWETAHPRTN